jgi:hypothetical protein
MDNKVENSSNMLDYFYSFCEASGDFWGNIHAKILTNSADVIAVGVNGIKKGNEKYFHHVTPALEKTKKIISEKNNQ